jgi:hypothetical protein
VQEIKARKRKSEDSSARTNQRERDSFLPTGELNGTKAEKILSCFFFFECTNRKKKKGTEKQVYFENKRKRDTLPSSLSALETSPKWLEWDAL